MKGKYSSQIENGWLHKVTDLLWVTQVYGEGEKIELGRGRIGDGNPSRPKQTRVAKTQPHKPDR